MKPFDDDGRELDAIFSIEDAGDGIVRLILESRGGADGGPKPARNADYAPALELLLRRLGERGALVQGVEVYSNVTKKWPPADRKIWASSFPMPIDLATVTDFAKLRRELGRASAALGRQGSQTGGNPTKRLRFSLKWDDAYHHGADETFYGMLEDSLAAAPPIAATQAVSGSSRYNPLGAHLRTRQEAELRLKLSQIESIIGSPLPREAWTPQFWANAADHHSSRRGQWLGAGFKAYFEKRSETVLFRREVGPEQPTADPAELSARARLALARMLAAGRDNTPPPVGSDDVKRGVGTVTRYVRDPKVVAWVLLKSDGHCEVCDEEAPFLTIDGTPFLEVHHVRPLAEGGPDKTDNAVAACPNCHRRLHVGADRDALRLATVSKIARLKDYPYQVSALGRAPPSSLAK